MKYGDDEGPQQTLNGFTINALRRAVARVNVVIINYYNNE